MMVLMNGLKVLFISKISFKCVLFQIAYVIATCYLKFVVVLVVGYLATMTSSQYIGYSRASSVCAYIFVDGTETKVE